MSEVVSEVLCLLYDVPIRLRTLRIHVSNYHNDF